MPQDLSQMSTEELLRMRNGARQAPAQTAPRGPVFGPAPAPERPKTAAPPSPSTVYRTLSPQEAEQRGLDPGGVYQESATGSIKTVQAPQRSREGGAIPVNASTKAQESISQFTALSRAANTFQDEFAGNTVTGELENTANAYLGLGTPGQSEWWADFRATDNLIRNSLFGASLTEGEKAAYNQTTVQPGMDPQKVRDNLARRREIVLNALARDKEFYIANGYKPEAVDVLFSPITQALVAPDAMEGEGLDNVVVTDDSPDDGVLRGVVTDDSPPRPGEPGGGPVQTIGTNLGNTLIGYAQGAGEAAIDFPLTIGAAPQVAMNSLIGGARAMYNDATGDPTEAARIRAQTEQMNQQAWQGATPVANVFNEYLPAPQGYQTQRDVARFAGGFLVPGPKGARPAPRLPAPANAPRAASGVIDNAAEVVAEGQRRNVPVMTTDIKPPQSGMGRFVKQTLPEKIPFAGTSGPRANQQTARVEAVKEVVEDFGGTTGRELFDSAPNAVEDIAKSLGDERTRRISNFKQAKDGVIDSVQQPFNAAPKTVQAISEQVRKLQEIDPEEFAPVIDRLQRFGERLTSGASLRTVEEQRKLLGELFTDPNLARIKSQGQKALNAIYDPLRQDMGDFIEATAGTAARAKWSKANEGLSAMAGELKSARFRNVLRDADVTPEAVNRILFADMNNVTDMQRLVSNLPVQGKAKVKTALIQRAFDDANGPEGVSVERFVTNIERLSGKIGVAFDGNEKRSIEGLRRLMNATRRGAAAGANIRTGEQNLPTVLGIGATQVAGVTGGVGTLGVGGLLARLYESPAMRDRFIRLAATKQGSPQEAKALDVLMRAAVPTINQWRATLPNAINDNPAARLAAEEQQPSEPR